jgi:putative ATP-dependent endonuclease of OLD family
VAGLQRELGDLIASMPHRLQVDFEAYNPVNFFHALRLQATEGNEPRTLEEMGTGEQQVLMLAFAYVYAKAFHQGIVLVIEEPEAHLHPLAQQWLAQRLKSRCSEGLQVLITTHSPAFISVEGLEGLVLVYKENGSTRVRQLTRGELVRKCIDLGAPRERVTEDNILPFYAANATTELLSGFFARVVVLVEGPTETLALPVLLAKRDLQVEKEGIGIISVGGKGNLAKWYRLYTAYGIPCYIVFDNDESDDGDGRKRKDALTAVGLEPAMIDRLVGERDWIVEEQYTIFGRDFETIMRFYFADYSKLEDEARAQGIDSKPFIARWVAERLDPKSSDLGWEKLDEMVERLRNLARYPSLSGQKAPGEDDFLF